MARWGVPGGDSQWVDKSHYSLLNGVDVSPDYLGNVINEYKMLVVLWSQYGTLGGAILRMLLLFYLLHFI